MKSVTFLGTRAEVQSQAAKWKAENPQAQIVYDCAPMAAFDVGEGPEPPHDKPVWTCIIRYEEPTSN
jgi:hypothetical protein